jgi:hypothetical protein
MPLLLPFKRGGSAAAAWQDHVFLRNSEVTTVTPAVE